MRLENHKELLRPSYADIICLIKKSDGLSVADMARALGKSYMGIKQHCQTLEKLGYLQTWRIPRTQVGRPEKFYLLTDQCKPIFPDHATPLLGLLKSSAKAMGPTIPEKLLFSYFQERSSLWQKEAECDPDKPIPFLVKQLSKDGYYVEQLEDSTDDLNQLLIYHHPLQRLFAEFPNAEQVELRSLEVILSARLSLKYHTTTRGQNQTFWTID